jgi:hypothetical protein
MLRLLSATYHLSCVLLIPRIDYPSNNARAVQIVDLCQKRLDQHAYSPSAQYDIRRTFRRCSNLDFAPAQKANFICLGTANYVINHQWTMRILNGVD